LKAVARAGTLTDALVEIGRRSGRDVAFIVDEAQHALASQAGLDAMFALKAARDAMNQAPEGPRLYLVFTGSHRDKLAALVLDHKAPFYGATVADFPKLGREYTDALVTRLNPRLAAGNQLDPEDVARAFELLGHRPEKLTEVIREHALGEEGSAGLRRTVTDRADALRARVWQQHESDYGALSDLQKAVLGVLIADGPAFAPFAERTLGRIGARLSAPPPRPRCRRRSTRSVRRGSSGALRAGSTRSRTRTCATGSSAPPEPQPGCRSAQPAKVFSSATTT
jgi:hypothetical protein